MTNPIADNYEIEYLDSILLDGIDYQLFISKGENVTHPFRVRGIDFETGEVIPVIKSYKTLNLAEKYFYSLSTMGTYSCKKPEYGHKRSK